jgi:Predicted dinucleotide-binding enzymes
MRIGILGGTGKEGAGLAQRWALGGHEVIIGSRDAERARAKAAELSVLAGNAAMTGMSNLDAARAASVVVLTLPATGLAPPSFPSRRRVAARS